MGHAMDLILTGRRVDAAEALQMGLCNRVVPRGGARGAAIALARQLADFPQATMLADRMSAHAQADLPLAQALHQEWERGRLCLGQALEGAARFAAGEGRNGRF
jgi:enoyl-CoA hydratase